MGGFWHLQRGEEGGSGSRTLPVSNCNSVTIEEAQLGPIRQNVDSKAGGLGRWSVVLLLGPLTPVISVTSSICSEVLPHRIEIRRLALHLI